MYKRSWTKLVGGFNPFEKYARQNGNLPHSSGWNKKYLSCHHLEKVLDSAAAGGCFSIESVKQVTRISDLKRVQSVVTVATQMWTGCEQCTNLQVYYQNPQKPWNFLGFLLFMTTIFIPCSYMFIPCKFLIIGYPIGCKTPGMVAFFSPLGCQVTIAKPILECPAAPPSYLEPSRRFFRVPRRSSLSGSPRYRLLASFYMDVLGCHLDSWCLVKKGENSKKLQQPKGQRTQMTHLTVVHTLKTRSFGWRCRPKTKTSEGKVGCCQKSANASVFCRSIIKPWT